MPFPRPEVDIRTPPSGFDDLIDWLERWSYSLVLLEEFPLADVRAGIRSVESAVRAHTGAADRWVAPLQTGDEENARGARVILHDHEWFATSLEQFWWFYRVVERDDHGGHRQALGQYGRVLAEALRRHRRDERRLEGRQTPRSDAGLGPPFEKP